METTITTVRYLNPTAKPIMRRIYGYVDPEVYDKLVAVAQNEELELSATIRELLNLGLHYYRFKQGTLNPNNPQNTKTFYCQVCRELTSVRKQHSVVIMFEQYKFCEDCFFNGKFKKLLHEQVDRI